MKVRKSAGGSWKTFFAIGKPAGSGRRKPMRISSLFQPATSHAGCRVDSVTLRSAKSEESLSSQHSGAGQSKLQRLRRPRSSSDGLALAASVEPQLLPQRPSSRLPPSRSYDSLLPEEARDPEEEEDEEEDEDDEEDEEGVYMLPDFSQDPASSWMAEDVIDFSPTFLEDGPIGIGGGGAGGGRESRPAATPPPYRCVSHQGHAHSRSHSQRSITEDPDSVLNQSEAAARRSLILAATAPPLQVYCQHRPPAATGPAEPSTSPSHGQPASSAPQPPPERRSFTRKVVHALSPKAPKSPPLDISDPIAISVPAKVLEMIGGRAGELQPGPQGGGSTQPPQMISMLLRSCDFQLTDSCQQEIRSKLGPDPKVKGQGFMLPTGPSLPSQQPPPPPPKNPARLMALALAESANKALRQGASPPYRPPQPKPQEPPESRFTRSLSMDTGEVLSSSSPTEANQLYSTVRPLSVWMSEGENNGGAIATTTTAADASEGGEQQSGRNQVQDTGTLSSSVSGESGGSNSEVSAGSSSGDTDPAPSPVYKNQEEAQPGPPPFPEDRATAAEAQAQRKPPAYSRQFSAPHLQQKGAPRADRPRSRTSCTPSPSAPPWPRCRAPLSRADNYMRRSLDAARIRRIIAQSQGASPTAAAPASQPLSRAFSERLSGTSDAGASSSEDQGKMENFYYEIAAPDHPQAPPSYAWHSYQNMRLELEGNYRPGHAEAAQRPLEMHPALAGSAPSPAPGTASALPLSVHKQQRSGGLHHSQRSPSSDLSSSQLHPYFENGKAPKHHPHPQPEPVYVNFPFVSPAAASSAKSWMTTDLDADSQQASEPPAPPPEPPPEGKQEPPSRPEDGESPGGPEMAGYESPAHGDRAAQDPLGHKVAMSASSSPAAAAMAHFRSRSDPQSSSTEQSHSPGLGLGLGLLTGKDIASLLIERLAEDEGESACAVTSSSTSSSPPLEHPPNPYPSQQPHQHQPAYNVYTPGPSRSRFEGGPATPRGGTFHRQDPLRRSSSSSSGAQYRQAFDVMPSGDQVLKFYRTQDFASAFQGENPNPNPYPSRPLYQDPQPYPGRSPQDPHPNYPAPSPSDAPHPSSTSPSAAISNLTLGGGPRGYGVPAGGLQTAMAPPYGQYQFQSVPMLGQYPNPPRREPVLDPSLRAPGLQNQRGLTRQGSLPGPNWTIHSEGQTRSYC
ncbi:hypothetical protein AAFF_G00204820 [Aldrovandia affinis]|uniref:Uncharacterized protein n=1 Tax=Aldrovandia affinis TaxID=143900 RepID=A0AAD7W4Z2_9TELE|nr:hypothetical protein AAFF_G00204820 [Aldrovandia affinis]